MPPKSGSCFSRCKGLQFWDWRLSRRNSLNFSDFAPELVTQSPAFHGLLKLQLTKQALAVYNATFCSATDAARSGSFGLR